MTWLLSLIFVAASVIPPTDAVSSALDDLIQGHSRQLQTVTITDATNDFVPSTESIFDHMVTMNGADNLSFHWNDISGSDDVIKGRLIHKSDSVEQAPSWLGFGVYHSNHDYTTIPAATDSFMKGSHAMIGMVTDQAVESAIPAKHYLLADQNAQAITETTDASVLSATILQHDSDDGTVITELTFSKKVIGSPSASTELRREGNNVFLWAVGPPGISTGVLGKHTIKGVMFLDFQNVRDQATGSTSTSTTTTTTSITGTTVETSNEGATSSTTNDPADIATSTQQISPSTQQDMRPNNAPVVSAQCTSTIFGEGPGIGKVPLTPTSTFSFQILTENKIQIALEHSSKHPVWLGVASSPNGYMVGSSAIIGSPGNDAQAISPPRRFSLMDQTSAGVQESPDPSLENASVESATTGDGQELCTLKFIKPLFGDVNEPNPILRADQGTTATFLYAVGEGRELAYHQHRGAFRVDLSQCGGSIAANGDAQGTSNTSKVWSNHTLFAVHGFLAALAWAFFTPFAITVAWFRTLVPASWIYIHVFANVFTVLLTVLAFALAVGGVAKQDSGDHFSKTHHWVGTVLLAVAAFQVTNGFLRPPVERKDPPPGAGPSTMHSSIPPQEIILGIFPVPRTPREAWHATHRMMGLAALAMGVYQMQSGLKLYSMRFQTTSIVNYYWMYVGIFVVSLIVLKLYVIREEDRARQGVLQAVSTTEPNPEDEQEAETVGMSHVMA
jgi:hypothetical protein